MYNKKTWKFQQFEGIFFQFQCLIIIQKIYSPKIKPFVTWFVNELIKLSFNKFKYICDRQFMGNMNEM
jgi:hypothetical protein